MEVLRELLEPDGILLLSLLAGALLLWTRWQRLGRMLTTLAAGLALTVGVLPLAGWMTSVLENRFPTMEPPVKADGVVVLGGAFTPYLSYDHGQPALNDAAERLVTLVRLQHLYPNAKFVYSGGAESDLAREMLASMGVDTDRILFDRQSESTHDNAVLARELADPKLGETWILVTSAYHMPRAVATFRAVGWNVVPFPVDYRTPGDFEFELGFGLYRGLDIARIGVEEWTGLLAYRLLGWTKEVFPR